MPMRSTPEPTMLRIGIHCCLRRVLSPSLQPVPQRTITTSKKIYMLNKSSDTVTAIKDASSTRNTP